MGAMGTPPNIVHVLQPTLWGMRTNVFGILPNLIRFLDQVDIVVE